MWESHIIQHITAHCPTLNKHETEYYRQFFQDCKRIFLADVKTSDVIHNQMKYLFLPLSTPFQPPPPTSLPQPGPYSVTNLPKPYDNGSCGTVYMLFDYMTCLVPQLAAEMADPLY